MGLFTTKEPTLHDLHAEAHDLGARALGVFHALADDLRGAAIQHADVAAQADAQIAALVALRNDAELAAGDKHRAADAILNLVK